jgi:hypothetical protein
MTPLRLIGNPSYSEIPHCKRTPSGEIVEFPPLVGRRLGQNYPLGGGWGLRMHSARTVLRRIEERNNVGQPVALSSILGAITSTGSFTSTPLRPYFRLDGFARDSIILAGAAFAPMSAVLKLERPAA